MKDLAKIMSEKSSQRFLLCLKTQRLSPFSSLRDGRDLVTVYNKHTKFDFGWTNTCGENTASVVHSFGFTITFKIWAKVVETDTNGKLSRAYRRIWFKDLA